MLVLSRKKEQKILIGADVTITVVDIGDGKVRLGIEAPKHIKVFRQEVAEAMARDGARRDSGSER